MPHHTDKQLPPLSAMTAEDLRAYFTGLARVIESVLPPGPSARGKCLFALIVCDGPDNAQYVGNAERAGIVKMLREAADRIEKREDVLR